MSKLRLTAAIAATVLITSFGVTSATSAIASPSAAPRPHLSQIRPDSYFEATDEGEGATLQAAERQAVMFLHGDYWGCVPPYTFTGDGQLADGTWWADIEELCQGYN